MKEVYRQVIATREISAHQGKSAKCCSQSRYEMKIRYHSPRHGTRSEGQDTSQRFRKGDLIESINI